MQVKGGKEVTLTPGQTFYEGPNDIHTVGRNASRTTAGQVHRATAEGQGRARSRSGEVSRHLHAASALRKWRTVSQMAALIRLVAMDFTNRASMSDYPPRRPIAGAADPFASSFATSYAGVVSFLAVANEGSFARAGDRLGIGRSSVSRNVQKLEAQLDARLFLRTTRSTSLTREGELFYENCQPGIERIAQALEDMRELRNGPPRGHLRIVSTPGFGRKIVAPLLRGFHSRYPEIALELLLNDRPADFTADRVDVAFRDGRMEDSGIVARQLIPMQMLVCASPAYARNTGCRGMSMNWRIIAASTSGPRLAASVSGSSRSTASRSGASPSRSTHSTTRI